MSHHAWFEHFKEQLQGLTESFDRSGSKLSLLGYALKEQLLSSDVYLKWAITYYKLPILQSRFFIETSLSQEMFAKWATHYPWSEECLPVAEWDGCLIIACLQPPQDFPPNPTAIYILSTFESLQQAWSHLQSASEKSPDAPAGIDLSNATVIQPSAKKESFSVEDLGIEESPDEPSSSISSEEPAEENSSDGKLEGLFDQPTVVRLEALSPEIKPPAVEKLGEPNSNSNPAESHLSDNKTVVVSDIKSETQAAPSETPKIPLSKVAEPVSEKTLPGIRPETNTLAKLTPRSTGIVKPTLNPSPSGNLSLEKIKKKNTALLGEKIKTTLSQMKTHFEKSMILSLDDQETQAVAFAWDENFQQAQDLSSSIQLKTPSIFNIVSSTQKPFHGYISSNQINDNFFANWNEGRTPEHVTIAPILINEKVIGLLMGFGTKETYNKVSLNLAEKLSNDFIKGLPAA